MSKLINGNPHWYKVWEISEFFRAIALSFPEAKVDMGLRAVNCQKEHSCGAPACHAGWAALMKPKGPRGGYIDGATFIAKKLGFWGGFRLEDWAENNPTIWGSGYGEDMFAAIEAFGKSWGEKITLEEIADHWLKVAKRLHKLQDGAEL